MLIGSQNFYEFAVANNELCALSRVSQNNKRLWRMAASNNFFTVYYEGCSPTISQEKGNGYKYRGC